MEPKTSGKTKRREKAVNFDFATDFRKMKAIFRPLMAQYFGEGLEITDIGVEVLRSRSKRCVLRYQVNAAHSREPREVQWRVIGKIYRAESGQQGYDNMVKLWASGFSRDATDGISMPEPLCFLPRHQMLFQEEVPGSAMRVLVKAQPEKSYFIQLARSIAKLHRCPLKLDRVFTVRDHLLRCHPKHPLLVMACPELEEKVDHIVRRAFDIEKQFSDIEPTPFHGDFHLGQVHIQNGQVWLIDFDTLSYGDPAADLGNILVFLNGKTRRHPEYREMIDTFLGEYFSRMDERIARRIALYEALTHLRRACKRVRLQEERDWRQKVAGMIDQGVAAIDQIQV